MKLTATEIETAVRALLVDQLGLETGEVTTTATLIHDLGADDLDLVELTMAVEDRFGIEVTDEQAGRWRRVSDVVGYLQSRVGAMRA